jgi:hypothetical protein
MHESWDGTSWSIVASPNEGTGDNALRDASCVSVSSCMAVGWYDDTGHIYEPLIESWNPPPGRSNPARKRPSSSQSDVQASFEGRRPKRSKSVP